MGDEHPCRRQQRVTLRNTRAKVGYSKVIIVDFSVNVDGPDVLRVWTEGQLQLKPYETAISVRIDQKLSGGQPDHPILIIWVTQVSIRVLGVISPRTAVTFMCTGLRKGVRSYLKLLGLF